MFEPRKTMKAKTFWDFSAKFSPESSRIESKKFVFPDIMVAEI